VWLLVPWASGSGSGSKMAVTIAAKAHLAPAPAPSSIATSAVPHSLLQQTTRTLKQSAEHHKLMATRVLCAKTQLSFTYTYTIGVRISRVTQ